MSGDVASATSSAGGLAVGIDVGTTSVKALALDGDGAVVAVASSGHGIVERSGVLEASPESWWESTVAALGSLAGKLGGTLEPVDVVGLSGNMSSVVLVDGTGAPVRDAMLLADNRGAEQLAALSDEVRAELTGATHNPVSTVFSLASLLWLRDEEPGSLARASTWLCAKDYVRLRLTGQVATELTDAYNSLLIRAGGAGWEERLVEAVGLELSSFPPVVDSGAVVGEVTEAAGTASRLPAGTPVVAGTGDMAAAVLGTGDPEPGRMVVSLGTSATAIVCIEPDGFDPGWSGRLTYHPLPRQPGAAARPGALVLASLLTGGLAVNWLRRLAGDDVLDAPSGRPDPEDPLVFLPQLAGSGTPDFVDRMRGTLLGLRPSTTGADIAQALYEAVAFELADVVELLGSSRVTQVLLTGGGANLRRWTAVIADVLGRPTQTVATPDVSAVGAARLAWQAVGHPCPAPGGERALLPRDEYADAWRRRLERYRQARRVAVDYYTGSTHPGPDEQGR